MFYAISEAFNTLRDFMSAGGSVLWLIAILAAFMWAIILERVWYFNSGHKEYMSELKSEWESISDHSSWKAKGKACQATPYCKCQSVPSAMTLWLIFNNFVFSSRNNSGF